MRINGREIECPLNAGRNWVSFYGHASPATWSRETLLEADQLSALLNNAGRWPVVSEFGCWGGYFVEPEYTTLAHSWLLTADRGARAMLASSSLTESSSDRAIAEALIPPIPRKKTKPSRGAVRARLSDKRHVGERKKSRGSKPEGE